jgi:hypothetical protein
MAGDLRTKPWTPRKESPFCHREPRSAVLSLSKGGVAISSLRARTTRWPRPFGPRHDERRRRFLEAPKARGNLIDRFPFAEQTASGDHHVASFLAMTSFPAFATACATS